MLRFLQERVIERVGYVIIAGLILFAIFGAIRSVGLVAGAIGRRRDLYPEWVIRFFNWLDSVLERIVSLPEIVPAQKGRRSGQFAHARWASARQPSLAFARACRAVAREASEGWWGR